MVISDSVATAAEHKEWLKEMRGWLIVLATLAASVTYQAGLNPPGGFWQDSNGHLAGNPVLHDGPFVKRYLTFYYFNATAFASRDVAGHHHPSPQRAVLHVGGQGGRAHPHHHG